MTPANDKILIQVNADQKNKMSIGGNTLFTATAFDPNYRERSPTVGRVVEGNPYVYENDFLLLHHNLCYLPSPYHVQDDLFSIPFSSVIFAKIDKKGNITPVCGNLLCDRVNIESEFYLIEKEQYLDRVRVLDGMGTPYHKGQLLFTKPYSFYQIVWNWNGEERRVHKCNSEMVVGYVK